MRRWERIANPLQGRGSLARGASVFRVKLSTSRVEAGPVMRGSTMSIPRRQKSHICAPDRLALCTNLCKWNFGQRLTGCVHVTDSFPLHWPVGTGSGATGEASPSFRGCLKAYDGGSNSGEEPQSWLQQFPVRRVMVWIAVVVLAYQLRNFFNVAMGTFLISAIGLNFVDSEEVNTLVVFIPPAARRQALVLVFFTLIVALLILFGAVTIPDIVREGADFVQRLQNDNIWVVVLEKMRAGLGDNIMQPIERFLLLATADNIIGAPEAINQAWTPEHVNVLALAIQKLLRGYTEAAVSVTTEILSFVTRFALQMFVSLVASFFFVWDFPKIRGGMATLKNSRLSDVYDELAPKLEIFGQLFGKALQAQALIALINTALTALGLWILQIPNIGLLSLFVAICGFIPVAGVFISTSPMVIVALTEYGFLKVGAILLMVFVVHLIEAYGLNPMIYSAHLNLHPLLVMAVLVVAEHVLGVWGLMLAVPLTVFALDYVIRYPAYSMPEVAAKELENVLMESRPS